MPISATQIKNAIKKRKGSTPISAEDMAVLSLEIKNLGEKESKKDFDVIKSAVREHISEIMQEELVPIIEEWVNSLTATLIDEGMKGEKGDKGDSVKGDKGDRGDKGEKGKSLQGTARPQGDVKVKGKKGDKGEKGEQGSPDTVKEIASKLNTEDGIIKMDVISGLNQKLESIGAAARQRNKKGGGKSGGGMGNPEHETFSISAATTSVTTEFKIAAGGNAIFKAAYEGQELHKGVHFTVSGKIITFAAEVQAQLENDTNFDVTYIRS